MNVVCEWGLAGLRASARGRIVGVIDVLSFSTAATVAVSRGATIIPCDWNDERAAQIAKSENAELASKRGHGKYSLAPASLRDIASGTRLVLPSPNGSTLAYAARDLDAEAIVIASIRNATAVARWIGDRPTAVIPAGEKWPDGSQRFAIEDWLGAGAVITSLAGSLSYDAEAAKAAFASLRGRLRDVLAASRSGIELIDKGYPDDVDLASDLDADDTVPLFAGNGFTNA